MKGVTPLANILIFEDDLFLVESWQNVLGAAGHQVEHTANLDTAMAKIYEGDVDIVLVDIFIQENHQQVPRGGIMLISKIHMIALENRPWLIAVSGRSSDSRLSVLEVAKRVGADEYLKKPVDLRELITVVDRAIRARSNDLGPSS